MATITKATAVISHTETDLPEGGWGNFRITSCPFCGGWVRTTNGGTFVYCAGPDTDTTTTGCGAIFDQDDTESLRWIARRHEIRGRKEA